MEVEGSRSSDESQKPTAEPFLKIVIVAAIAAGIQFGWALQLSLLTPYIQLLGVPHQLASLIWLCGPISGLIVQPIVGYYSDHCGSSFGRRRPFIAGGSALVIFAVFLIGFAADLGHATGDALGKVAKPRAIIMFVLGFWFLDVANNMLQGPCRALLADMSDGSAAKMGAANALFSFFMAVGNVCGYAAGSYTGLYKLFPFSQTDACDIYCANLKSCFIISVTLLLILTVLALCLVGEKQFTPKMKVVPLKSGGMAIFRELFTAVKELPYSMKMLLLVTCFNWIGWFPFLLYDTDWMGREVYGGKVGEILYDQGVRAGSLGLLVLSVVLAFGSLLVQHCARKPGSLPKLWGLVNLGMAVTLAFTVLVTKEAQNHRRHAPDGSLRTPPPGVKAGAILIFAALGLPQAITFSVPFALASIFSVNSKVGQGLSLGVLNLSIVAPQILVSFGSGPFDNMYGGGNLPAFIVGAIAAAISGLMAFILLPKPSSDAAPTEKVMPGGGH